MRSKEERRRVHVCNSDPKWLAWRERMYLWVIFTAGCLTVAGVLLLMVIALIGGQAE